MLHLLEMFAFFLHIALAEVWTYLQAYTELFPFLLLNVLSMWVWLRLHHWVKKGVLTSDAPPPPVILGAP